MGVGSGKNAIEGTRGAGGRDKGVGGYLLDGNVFCVVFKDPRTERHFDTLGTEFLGIEVGFMPHLTDMFSRFLGLAYMLIAKVNL